MASLRKFLALSTADRVLLLKSVVLIAAAQLASKCLSLQGARQLLMKVVGSSRLIRTWQLPNDERLAWTMAAASRRVPGAKCLARALATEALLRSCGRQTTFYIGVRRDDLNGSLDAHAWLETVEGIVSGWLPALSEYVPLVTLSGGGT